jgi:hypothetical protein
MEEHVIGGDRDLHLEFNFIGSADKHSRIGERCPIAGAQVWLLQYHIPITNARWPRQGKIVLVNVDSERGWTWRWKDAV